MPSSARLGVVVAARNEEEDLPACLDAIQGQLLPGDKIAVIDNDSTDSTAGVALNRGIPCYHIAEANVAAARNLGAILCHDVDYLYFLDADETLEDGGRRRLQAYMDEGHGILSLTRVARGKTFIGRIRAIQRPRNENSYKIWRKTLFRELDGFDTRLKAGEDTDLLERAVNEGIHPKKTGIVYEHTTPSTLREVFSQATWRGSALHVFTLRDPLESMNFYLLNLFLASPLLYPVMWFFGLNNLWKWLLSCWILYETVKVVKYSQSTKDWHAWLIPLLDFTKGWGVTLGLVTRKRWFD